jgi:hypothetical protein
MVAVSVVMTVPAMADDEQGERLEERVENRVDNYEDRVDERIDNLEDLYEFDIDEDVALLGKIAALQKRSEDRQHYLSRNRPPRFQIDALQ